MTGSVPALWDPGAQHERTSLAWTRTCLAYTACSLLCVKLGAGAALAAGCVALAGTAAAMILLGVAFLRERHRAAALLAAEPVAAPVEVAVVTAMTVGLAIAVIALILTAG